MPSKKKIAYIGRNCVSCGTCVKTCPKQIITIHKGITAVIEEGKCVGCGKCAKECPAGIITMTEVLAA